MATHGSSGGNVSVGVGVTSDSDGASQQASGGSGGSQLTRSLDDTGSAAPSKPVDTAPGEPAAEPEGAGSAVTSATRGPQDTHSQQGGFSATGVGAPHANGKRKPGNPAPRK